ncbi:putative membrane protein [Streptomyces scabiei 87.22]|uniref:Putative membrane protein n=1 Tax=Streptomyces scabiei (strain 87.22) TaxID=680198 RepID=C9ZEL0_STRSW|nr:MFS transporter [Streptomyces scabiei]MDX2576888.1 MFS transporter [Streptomyces scabiei]MDX2656855.1 MFS transporter [Streptomyces scabiei]MDX2724289.1 MFS transporter [Streptomyces scabiei]MDX2868327.1 MFS transporter [Streptomyces scabiei]MDX2887253.1 MFS transporter [Streptomyces scabiei]
MTSTAPRSTTAPTPDLAQVQPRILRVLFASQVLSGAGLAAGVTVGALLAQDMLGSTSLAGLPSALFTTGSALAAVAVGRISQARGRRPGLATGYLTGAIGSAGVIIAAVLDNPVLLFITLFVYGAGTATNLQARYAGADLAAPGHRARAVSTVLVATTLGGVAGPNLAAPTGTFAEQFGIPALAGPFILGGAAYALAALVLALWLRPDPLLLARAVAQAQEADATTAPTDADTTEGREGVVLGALVMILTQLVMVAIMTMTPVHMHDHGHGTGASGLVIALHIGAMYLPSPVTGWLVDRYGHMKIAAASGIILLAAGILAAAAPGDSVALLALALALLGLGWNFGLVSGTAIITDTVPLATRAKTQGLVDVSIAIAGATGGMSSGIVVAAFSYPALALTGGILSLALLPAVAATAYRR